MSKARERFLLGAEAHRRDRTSVAMGLGGCGLVGAAAIAAVWLFAEELRDPGPPPARLLVPFAVFAAVMLFLFGRGLHARLRPRSYVEVDLEAATATFVEDGAVTRQVPLVQVGPLEHVLEQRSVSSGKSHRIATFHVARSAPFRELRVGESEDELATRRMLESRARAWSVPYVKPSGEVRSLENLDVPLFERLAVDEGTKSPVEPRPGSALAVAWKDDGYEITTSYRPKVDRVRLVVLFVVPLAALVWYLRPLLADWLRRGAATPYPWLAAGLVVLAFVPGAVASLRAWMRASRPPTIRVSPGGVRFRGRSLPLRSIEEIERERGGAPRLVSDERFLQIDADFCEASEYDWLTRELRRLVVEIGLRTPLT